jgi:ABC-type transport system substrate-binding protein
MYNIGAAKSPFKDVRVRQALNYCIDRDGLVTLLNGTAEPSVGWLKPKDAGFGKPANRYGFDPAKGKALLAEAGYTAAKPLSFKVMISTSGSGQMLPLPMNEYLQDAGRPGAARRHGAQRVVARIRRRHHGALFLVGELLPQRLQFRAVEG